MGRHPKAVGEAVNFGTGRDVTIKKTAELIKRLAGSGSSIIHIPHRTSEVHRLVCGNTKAKKILGWKPRFNLEQGLEANIEWARKNWL